MTIWIALLLGIVQGLCEFLPVSSSGHLLLLQSLVGINPDQGGAFFTVMLHVATLVSVCIVYRKKLLELIKHPFQKTVLYLIVATLPTVAVALLLKKVEPFASFYVIANEGSFLGGCFLITAAMLLLSDFAAGGGDEFKRPLDKMKLGDSLIIGFMQAIAVLPGVSRSGLTITGAEFASLDKKAAADFSFLMSIPAILGGAVLEAKDAVEAGSIGVSIPCLLVGMLAAGVTGYFAVNWMLKIIKTKKLWPFALYTGVLGIIVIILQFMGLVG